MTLLLATRAIHRTHDSYLTGSTLLRISHHRVLHYLGPSFSISHNQTNQIGEVFEAAALCSFDGRWAPVEYYLTPRDTLAVGQDTPNPVDIVHGITKTDSEALIQMK